MFNKPTEPSPNRHQPARRWFVGMAALLLVGLLVAGIFAALALALPRIRAARKGNFANLAGGARLELAGTSIGGATFTTDKPWMARARKILPGALQRWLPTVFTGICGNGSNSLTVWVRVSPAGAVTPVSWGRASTEDDSGFSYAEGSGYCSMGSGQLTGMTLRAYPRRQKDFLFHLLDAQGATVATFRVPNPAAGPFSEWQPLPLPQTATNGPVTLTLRGLERRQGWINQPYVSGSWKAESVQPGWSNATVRYWTLLDATGNEGQQLSPREPAWKFRAQVMRPNPGDFAPAEKLVLTNLPLQAAGHFLAMDQTNLAAGLTINVSVLCGAGCLAITNGTSRSMSSDLQGWTGHTTYGRSSNGDLLVEMWGATNSFFLVEAANTQAGDEIHFYLRDDLGRDVKIQANGWSGGLTGGRVYQPTFSAPADAKFVTLEVIVDRPLVFDFLVNPREVQGVKQ
jgi:hypothetical protein